jgi:hypothetical protein
MKTCLPVAYVLLARTIGILLFLTAASITRVQAQDCACDHTVEPPPDRATSVFVDGAVLGILPGQTVCLKAGFYMQIRFINITGEPGNPVVIKNCGGQVVIGDEVNYGRWYAADIGVCKFIRLTGSGDAAYKYGIKLGKSGDSGLKIGGRSTDTEIDHLEIGNSNFAGILAKTDFGGNPPPDAPEMNNVNIHDNYIHDTRGEGMYIGETKTPGQNFRHMEVWNNIVTRTGLDLMQVANVIEDIEVHHNVFYKGGLRNVLYQNKGFQIGDNSVGKYFNNFVIGSPSNAMIVMGSGDIDIFNNYFSGAGDPGFFIDNRTVTLQGAPINIFENYIRDVKETVPFFNIYNELNPVNITENKLEGNNVLIGLGSGAGPNVTESGNIVQTVDTVQFTDAPNDNFTLAPGSLYEDIGLMENPGTRNSRPYIALIADLELNLDSTLQVQVAASDADGDALTLEAFDVPSFVSFIDNGSGNGTFLIAPRPGDAGVYYKVRVRVTDSKGGMNSEYFTITVNDPNALIATASSSAADTSPENTLDGNMTTRWAAATGTGNWIKYDLRDVKRITSVNIAFYNGASVIYPFSIEVSEDDANWTPVFSGASSGTTAEFEKFSFATVSGKYVRITDSSSSLNSYTEVVIDFASSPVLHTFVASDDIYSDGKKIFNNDVLKGKEPRVHSFLRFSITGLDVANFPVMSVTLKVKAVENGQGSLKISLGDERTWTEDNVTAANLPAPVHTLAILTTTFTAGQDYELILPDAIRDNGVYNFVLAFEQSKPGLSFSSSEGVFAPQLIVETAGGATVTTNGSETMTTESSSSDSNNSAEVRVYPNPVTHRITVDFGPEASEFVSLEIYNRAGETVLGKSWTDVSGSVDLNLHSLNMRPGIYYLKIIKDELPPETIRLMKR